MSESKDCKVNCCVCGITFKFSEIIEGMWRRSGKTFFCPNGHGLNWDKNKHKDKDEEKIESLEKEIQELKDKLSSSQEEIDKLKEKITELETELEIWKPSDKSI